MSFVPRKQALAKNIEQIGYHDLQGKPWFQMAMQVVDGRYYLYGAHFRHGGFAVVDVTDPSKPEYLNFVRASEFESQGTPKVQVADGLMIGALGGLLPMLHGNEWDDAYEEGIIIWDVKDPANPKELSRWRSGGELGVHRFFYNGGHYVHLSAACRGFKGYIYRILDISDPTNPIEAGRWWYPDQWAAGYVPPKDGKSSIEGLLDAASMHGPATWAPA
jgi:hypothetical protein